MQERVRHIDYTPEVPEPYYVPTGREPKPKPVGDEFGTVIFHYSPTGATNYVSAIIIKPKTIEIIIIIFAFTVQQIMRGWQCIADGQRFLPNPARTTCHQRRLSRQRQE